MTLESAIAFTLAMTLFSLSPGPGIAATISHAIQKGFTAAMALLTGLVVGDAIYLVAAISGLASLVMTYEHLLSILRVASGIYLVFLGYQTFRDANRPLLKIEEDRLKPNPKKLYSKSNSTLTKSFLLGVGLTFGNPKVVLFYLGLMPSFLDLERMEFSDTLIALSILVVVSYATYAPLSYLAIKATRRRTPNPLSIFLRRGAGIALAVTGILISTSLLRS